MKKYFAFLLSLALIMSMSHSVFANEAITDGEEVITVVTWQNPNWEQELNEMVGSENDNRLRYGEREESTVVDQEYRTITTTPAGQYTNGFKFPEVEPDENGHYAYTGVIYVNPDGGSPATYNFNFGYGPFSLSIAPGSASTSQVSALGVNVPGDGNYYKVRLKHNYLFTTMKIDRYQYTELVGTSYRTYAVVQSLALELIKGNN